MKNIVVKVIYDNKEYLSTYSNDSGAFIFTNELSSLNNTIKIREICDKYVVISYMFSTSYVPQLFKVTKDNPVNITDYISINNKETYIKIIISLE